VSSYFGSVIGGALNFIKELAVELTNRGHSVSLLLDDRYKELFSEKEFEIIWFSSLKITAYSPSWSFLKIISKIDVDVIHLNGYMSFQTDFGALISYFRKIPIVLTPHGSLLGYDYLYDNSFSKIPYHIHDGLTLKLPAKIAKYVIATSKAEFRDCVKFGVNKNKIKLIPLSFSPPKNIIKKDSMKKSKVLFVGRIVPLKNLDIIIRSIKILEKDIPEIELVIVGDEIQGRLKGDSNYKERLVTIVESLGLSHKVKFDGWKSGKELWEVYQNSDVFILASTYENFGLPLLEAACLGLPLISTDVGVASELIDENKGGRLIIKNEPEEFAKAVLEITDRKRYEDASNHIKEKSKKFSIKSVVDRYEEIFKGVVKN